MALPDREAAARQEAELTAEMIEMSAGALTEVRFVAPLTVLCDCAWNRTGAHRRFQNGAVALGASSTTLALSPCARASISLISQPLHSRTSFGGWLGGATSEQ